MAGFSASLAVPHHVLPELRDGGGRIATIQPASIPATKTPFAVTGIQHPMAPCSESAHHPDDAG